MSIILGLALLQGAGAAPLQPTGKWTVSYEDSMCVLSRTYGAMQIGFKPVTFGDVADVLIVIDNKGPEYRLGKGRLVLRPGGVAVEGRVRSWKVPDQNKRVIALEVPRTSLPQIAQAVILTVDADKRAISITQTGGDKAFAALDTCEQDLVASMQPSSRPADLIETDSPTGPDTARASGSPAYWLTADDYPMEAVRLGLDGVTNARWIIGTDGRVKHCMITGRSDHPALDDVVCRALRERGRYRPASGPAGKPVESTASRRVVWQLPD